MRAVRGAVLPVECVRLRRKCDQTLFEVLGLGVGLGLGVEVGVVVVIASNL